MNIYMRFCAYIANTYYNRCFAKICKKINILCRITLFRHWFGGNWKENRYAMDTFRNLYIQRRIMGEDCRTNNFPSPRDDYRTINILFEHAQRLQNNEQQFLNTR